MDSNNKHITQRRKNIDLHIQSIIIEETDTTHVKKYKKAIIKFLKIEKIPDTESSHINQDKIYRQFIRDIYKKVLTDLEIEIISGLIHKNVVNFDTGRWYS